MRTIAPSSQLFGQSLGELALILARDALDHAPPPAPVGSAEADREAEAEESAEQHSAAFARRGPRRQGLRPLSGSQTAY